MKIRIFPLIAILVLPLAGCVTINLPDLDDKSLDKTSEPTEAPVSSSPEPSAELTLTLPTQCVELVPLSVIQTQFSTSFVSIDIPPTWGGEHAIDFRDRGGTICLWGLPSSDAAGVTVYVAALDDTADAKIAGWRSAGMMECPPFLDGCLWEKEDFPDFGTFSTMHAILKGYEMEIAGPTVTLDPLLEVGRAVASSMGYR